MTLSDQIKNCRDEAGKNPYQGSDKRVLFVCSMGLLRSATAARIYGQKYNTRCVGTLDEALIQITPLLVAWSDEVVFMRDYNYAQAMNKLSAYPNTLADLEKKKRILNIPDAYPHMHPKLVEELKAQYEDC